MANIYEEISKSHAQSGGKTDANIANDANHLGGVPAEQYATKKYVKDYHDNKEAGQKEYIDEQDRKMLQEAKEYTNSQIRNQDFSSFAKLTDVQAVDTKLSNKIEECGQQCATNLATQIKAVVDDTNANFVDVNNAISNLNKNQNDLFQSVSNGKSKIAGAITDKGVPTSANDTYDTMAGNIRSIQTGGGELDDNFVNTSDGTATASDILLGKTAYAQGQKIYGGLIYPETEDSSDATATPYDILQGKTAYVQGRKIQGILNIDENNKPSYDIGAVEKIYGTVTGGLMKDTVPLDLFASYSFVLLKNSTKNEIDGYIRIFREIVDNQYAYKIETKLYSKENGFYNSKIYTAEELGLNSIGIGLHGIQCICCSDTSNREIYLGLGFKASQKSKEDKSCFVYKINFTSEKVEKGLVKNFIEIDVTQKWIIPINDQTYSSNILYVSDMTFSKNNPKIVAILKYYNTYNSFVSVAKLSSITNNLERDEFAEVEWQKGGEPGLGIQMLDNRGSRIRFKNNDKILELKTYNRYISQAMPIYTLIILNNYSPTYKKVIGNSNSTSPNIYVTNKECTILKEIKGNLSTGLIIKHYNLNIDYISNNITTIEDTTKQKQIQMENISSYPIQHLICDDDVGNGIALFRYYEHNGSSNKSYTFVQVKIDFTKDDAIIFDKIIDNYSVSGIKLYIDDIYITGDSKGFYYYNNSEKIITVHTLTNDYSKVIGLKYENEYFYKQEEGLLTAGQPDVRAGKTFIGWQGYPETGTMEV